MTHFKQPGPEQAQAGTQAAGSILKNSIFGILARAVDALMRFVILAMIARYLGPASFGDFAFITAISAFVLLIGDFGIEPIMIKQMSGTPERQVSILGSVLFIRLLFCIVLPSAILLLILFQDWPLIINIALGIETLTQMFIIFQITSLGVFRVYEKMEYDLFTSVIHQVVMFLLISTVLFCRLSFLWIFIFRFLAELCKMGMQLLGVVQRKFIRLTINPDVKYVKFLLKESAPILVLAFAILASNRMNVFFLKYFQGATAISLFDLPQRILLMVNMIPMMIILAIYPILCRQANSSGSAFSYTYQKSFKFLSIVGVAISCFFVVWAKDITLLLFGQGFLASYRVLQIVGGATCLQFWIGLMNFSLTSVDLQRKPIYGAWLGLFVNCIAALLLIPRFAHLGAAVAILSGNLTFLAINHYMISRYVCRVPVFFTLIKPGIAVLLYVLVSLPFINNGVVMMVVGMIIGFIGYLGVLYVTRFFTAEELQIFANILKRRKSPLE